MSCAVLSLQKAVYLFQRGTLSDWQDVLLLDAELPTSKVINSEQASESEGDKKDSTNRNQLAAFRFYNRFLPQKPSEPLTLRAPSECQDAPMPSCDPQVQPSGANMESAQFKRPGAFRMQEKKALEDLLCSGTFGLPPLSPRCSLQWCFCREP